MIFDTIIMALGAIMRNKMRSLLTSLGIIIGVGSVIAMIHLGQAATESVTDSVKGFGANMIIVQPDRSRKTTGGRRVSAPPFDLQDVDAIRRGVPGVIVAPMNSASETMVYGSATYLASITGTTNEYMEIRGAEIASGRAFTVRDIESGEPVCILGQTVVEALFVDRNPIGTTVRLGNTACQVIAVLEEKGDSFGSDQDAVVLMPFRAVQKRLTGTDDVYVIFASAETSEGVERAKGAISSLMRSRRTAWSDGDDDFQVRDTKEVIDMLSTITNTLTALLGAIAAISLLVGGIGIMNIMLVSVTERTREIGVRLAIGATARDIQLQFLVESSVLSALGGVFGILLGVSGSWLATRALELPFVLSVPAILVSAGFSAFIGIVFGFFPARKAARLNPIEALRHE